MQKLLYISISCLNFSFPRSSVRNRGFTLLEILVAIAIFSIMAAFSYATLQQVLSTNQHLQKQADELAELQFLFGRFLEDISQLVNRPIRDEFGATEPALIGSSQILKLTRSGWENPLESKRSNLQRVEWMLEGKTLYRQYWTVLDRTRFNQPIKTALLKDIESLEFRYLDSNNVWQKEFPPKPPAQITIKAVEMSFDLKNWGKLNRIVETTQAFVVKPVEKPKENLK
jgi:general secretion pathway protein J